MALTTIQAVKDANPKPEW